MPGFDTPYTNKELVEFVRFHGHAIFTPESKIENLTILSAVWSV